MINPHDKPAPPDTQPILQIQVLAADLAYGALKNMWTAEIPESLSTAVKYREFIVRKWNNVYPNLKLLVSFGYLINKDGSEYTRLTQKAFDLLESIPSDTKVFISYGRKEGSPFALAIQYKLVHLDVDAFLDKDIEIGDDFHAKLEPIIKNCDYFILLLGPNTLDSKYVRKEIEWAYESQRICLPIWYANFSHEANLVSRGDIRDEIKSYIGKKNAHIIDGKDSAASYHNSIASIVNRLGYTEI
jgi:hypothetical protein